MSFKVILLDHDGVICLPDKWGTRIGKMQKYRKCKDLSHNDIIPVEYIFDEYIFDDFNEDCVDILNDIIKETNCEIVVSSDWKKYTNLEGMREYYTQQGIIKKPIAFTRSTKEFTYPEMSERPHFGYELEYFRYWETKDYVDQNKPDSYVILDDLYLDEIEKNPRFIRTQQYMGLRQTGLKEKIINLLNNE